MRLRIRLLTWPRPILAIRRQLSKGPTHGQAHGQYDVDLIKPYGMHCYALQGCRFLVLSAGGGGTKPHNGLMLF